MTTDFSALTEQLVLRFWGEPSSKTKTEWRWGSGGSRSYKVDEHVWFDHEADKGGGTIELVMREEGGDKAAALTWLEEQGLIEGSSGRSGGQPRQAAPLLADEPQEQEREPVSTPEAAMKAVKGYRYKTRDGDPLYEVIRYHFQLPGGSWVIDPKTGNPKKTFRQRRPDGRGGHIWNLDGIGHTIYRHREVEMAIEAGWTVALMEGEKDVETLEGFGAVATTNSGGAKHWTPEMAAIFRGADVVVFTDNDDAGREGAEIKARSLRGIARRVRVLDLAQHVPDFPAKWDVTDWVERLGGTHERLVEIMNALPDWRPSPPKSKFNAISLRAIGTGIGAKHSWLVQDMIELGGSCALAGYSQSGKSFLVLKLTFAIVMGEQFFGRDVEPGMVVYQLGEGDSGFEKRIEGFMKDRGLESIEDLPLVIMPKKINLFSSDDDANNLIEEIKAWSDYHQQPCRMVVIDTFNKATRGMNEISGQDLGKVIDRVERIAAETGATVMVIDHLAKNGGIRGHGSKTDDFTNTIRVEEDPKKVDNNGRTVRYMITSKNKDGEKGGKIPFVLRQVVNGFDAKGRPITTCVVDPPDGSQEELEKSGRLPLNQAIVLRAVRDAVDREGTEPPQGLAGVPNGRHVVTWKAFMNELKRKWQYAAPESEPEQRAKEIHRIVTDAGRKLQLAGYIDRDNTAGVIWWTGKTDRPIPKPRATEPAPPPLPADVAQEIKDMEVPF